MKRRVFATLTGIVVGLGLLLVLRNSALSDDDGQGGTPHKEVIFKPISSVAASSAPNDPTGQTRIDTNSTLSEPYTGTVTYTLVDTNLVAVSGVSSWTYYVTSVTTLTDTHRISHADVYNADYEVLVQVQSANGQSQLKPSNSFHIPGTKVGVNRRRSTTTPKIKSIEIVLPNTGGDETHYIPEGNAFRYKIVLTGRVTGSNPVPVTISYAPLPEHPELTQTWQDVVVPGATETTGIRAAHRTKLGGSVVLRAFTEEAGVKTTVRDQHDIYIIGPP